MAKEEKVSVDQVGNSQFFYQEFKADPQPSLPLDLFTEYLDQYWERLCNEGGH